MAFTNEEIEQRKRRIYDQTTGMYIDPVTGEEIEELNEFVGTEPNVEPMPSKRKVNGNRLGGANVNINRLKGIQDKATLASIQKQVAQDTGITRSETNRNATAVLRLVEINLSRNGLYDVFNKDLYNRAVYIYQQYYDKEGTKGRKIDNVALDIYNKIMVEIGRPELDHLYGTISAKELRRYQNRVEYCKRKGYPLPNMPNGLEQSFDLKANDIHKTDKSIESKVEADLARAAKKTMIIEE